MFKIFLYFILIVIFITSCANPQPPSGGPQDTIPPFVLDYFPADRAIDFKDNRIILKFSKYMDKSSVMENIAISPETRLGFDWSGKELEITLKDTLDKNTTYSLNLGTDYFDLLKNKPRQAFSLTFSTGIVIDTGIIKGNIVDEKPAGKYTFVYQLDGIDKDTLNPATTKPDYKIQIGSSCTFEIPALKDGIYRLFVIKDEMKNGLYEYMDAFGTALSDIIVKDGKSSLLSIKPGPALDRIKPEIVMVTSDYSNRVSVKFTKPLDFNSISSNTFLIKDTLGKVNIGILSLYPTAANQSVIDLILKDNLIKDKIWSLSFNSDTLQQPRDTSGNLLNIQKNDFRFTTNGNIDTNKPDLYKTPFRDSTKSVKSDFIFDFIFNASIDFNSSKISFKLENLENKQEVEIKFLDSLPNLLKFRAKNNLNNFTWYKLKADFKSITSMSSGLAIDTSITISFQTEDTRENSSVSGKVFIKKDFCQGDVYLIMTNIGDKSVYKTTLNKKSEWNYQNLKPGSYTIEMFCDLNSDGKYNYGNILPFIFSEPFYKFSNIINVKARWSMENVVLTQGNP
jgi:uncharacterized protein (DUF2141 family)